MTLVCMLCRYEALQLYIAMDTIPCHLVETHYDTMLCMLCRYEALQLDIAMDTIPCHLVVTHYDTSVYAV